MPRKAKSKKSGMKKSSNALSKWRRAVKMHGGVIPRKGTELYKKVKESYDKM